MQEILNKLGENPNSPQAKAFIQDFSHLRVLLQNNGFSGYPGATYPLSGNFAKDFIFEAEDFITTFSALQEKTLQFMEPESLQHLSLPTSSNEF